MRTQRCDNGSRCLFFSRTSWSSQVRRQKTFHDSDIPFRYRRLSGSAFEKMLRIWGPNLSVKNKLGEKSCSTNSSGSYVHKMRATTEVLGWLLSRSRLTQENDMSWQISPIISNLHLSWPMFVKTTYPSDLWFVWTCLVPTPPVLGIKIWCGTSGRQESP